MDCLGSLFINKFRIDKNCHHLSLFTFTEVYLLIRYILSHSRLVGNSNTCKWICTSTYYYIFHQQPKKSENWAHKSVKWNALNLLSRYYIHASQVAAVQEIQLRVDHPLSPSHFSFDDEYTKPLWTSKSALLRLP